MSQSEVIDMTAVDSYSGKQTYTQLNEKFSGVITCLSEILTSQKYNTPYVVAEVPGVGRTNVKLTRSVIRQAFESLKPLTGKRIVVVGRGKRLSQKGSNYYDFLVMTEDEARTKGILK